jgi:predicted transcriptional regulator
MRGSMQLGNSGEAAQLPESAEIDTKKVVKLLGDETRRVIMRMASNSDNGVSPSEVAKTLGRQVSNVCYHFTCLENAEMIVSIRTEAVRGATKHFYRAEPRVRELPWLEGVLENTDGR